LQPHYPPRASHPFPTRRSSDLVAPPKKQGAGAAPAKPAVPAAPPAPAPKAPAVDANPAPPLQDETPPPADVPPEPPVPDKTPPPDRKSTRLNSSHDQISYAVFC